MTSRLFSTVTTVVTVAVAVALLLVLLTMRDSARRAFSRGSGNMHFVISAEPDPLTVVLNNIFYARPPRNPMMWKDFEALVARLPIAGGGPGFEDGFAIPIQHGDSYRGFPVLATTPEFFSRFEPVPGKSWAFRAGRAFAGDFEVVAGALAADGAGLRIGGEVELTHGAPSSGSPGGHVHDEFHFKVVGVLEPSGTAHDRALFISLQSAWIVHAQDRLEAEHAAGDDHGHGEEGEEEHLATAADLTEGDRKITGAYLRVMTRTGSNISSAMQGVFNQLRGERGFTVAQPADELRRLFAIVSNFEQILVVIAGVVMVSSGIAIMVALYNSMEQRRRQIAVLRVLGASRARIFGLILTESALLGILGAGAGIALALVGGWAVAAIARRRLGLVLEPWPAPDWLLATAMAAVLLAALAGIIPAVMAYRTSVARNLRPIG
jgi:putative ABC transport system permease protein